MEYAGQMWVSGPGSTPSHRGQRPPRLVSTCIVLVCSSSGRHTELQWYLLPFRVLSRDRTAAEIFLLPSDPRALRHQAGYVIFVGLKGELALFES